MKLRRLEIENFRGVKSLDWRHIAETAALVGPGDSGKSTILDSIERVLSPRWNVAFDDTDFWDLQTDVAIVIRATITDLAPSFYRDSKFGLLLHAFDKDKGEARRAEGTDDEVHALVVELRVQASLEPAWNVLDADGATHPFMARDREALGMLRVGGYVDQHLGWSRGSVLTRLTDSGDAVGAVLAEATRQARSGLKTEGATEEGLCMAFDEAWTKEAGASFGYRGVSVVDGGGGTQPAEIAGHLAALGYDVALLIDSDATAKAGKAAKATVLAWPDRVCTEQRLAMDLPIPAVKQMTVMAATSAKKGARSVRDAIADNLQVERATLAEDAPETWVDVVDIGKFRTALGAIAKQEKHAWFKSREQGAFLGGLVTEHWSAIADTPTRELIARLKAFAHG